MKIITYGFVPPPYGGVSIHIARLKEYLNGQSVENNIYDVAKIKNKSFFERVTSIIQFGQYLFQKNIIYHLHFLSIRYLVLFYFYSKIHKTVLSFHNERFVDELNKNNKIIKKLVLRLINSFHLVIVDNNKCKILAKSIIRDQSKIKVIPEFIPPVNVPELTSEIIMSLRKRHKYIISSNAFEISFHKDLDLYGIDILIETLNNIVNNNNLDAAVIFLLPNIKHYEYFKCLNERIEKYNLQNRFVFITKPLDESSTLWKFSDLVIRATNTDGNSLTIHEAQYLGVPVIASDCVERPEGAQLFRTRDIKDLTEKTCDVLLNLEKYRRHLLNINIPNNGNIFLTTYKSLFENEKLEK